MNNEEFDKLSNIADILSSDPVLGATLLVSQDIDLDLFVYHLLDNYNEFKVGNYFRYKYYDNSKSYSWNTNSITWPTLQPIDDMQDLVEIELLTLIYKLQH